MPSSLVSNVQFFASLAFLLSLAVPVRSTSFDLEAALHYLPSKALSALGLSLYLIIGSLVLFRLVRNRDWWGLCLPIAAFVEALGFLIRIFITRPSLRSSIGVYILMDSLIVLAPAAFLAFNYITYGRTVRLCTGREHSFIRPEIVGRTFVISDIATFLIQATGGSMQVQASSASVGRAIFLVGIIAQGVSYLIFDALVALSHRSIRRVMLLQGLDPHQGAWYKIFKLLYFSSFFIIVRSVYRVVETVQGVDGYLFTHEWCFIAFDTVPLAFATAVYAVYWPGNYIPKPGFATPIGGIPMSSSTQNAPVIESASVQK